MRVNRGILAAVLLVGGGPLLAEENAEPETGWSDTAELSLLATSGNAEAQTLALRNTLKRRWKKASLEVSAGGVRAESTTTRRLAVGTPDAFVLSEVSETVLSAENYFLKGRFDREISKRLFWFAGLGWERNDFAGINRRIQSVAGVGHRWFERDEARFRTDYAVSVTDEEDVAGRGTSFAGIRLSYEYGRRLTSTATFESALVLDENLDDTEDVRADLVNALTVAISERLALKVSHELLWDNQPALTQVPLVDAGGLSVGSVPAELETLDSTFTASLVATF